VIHAANPGSENRQRPLGRDVAETHRYQIGVLRDPHSRGGSIAVHDELTEGQLIRIGAPRNRFALVPAQRSLLLAGGIGITPVLCNGRAPGPRRRGFRDALLHPLRTAPSREAWGARWNRRRW
jgi:vanillate O-demethylase ferredoxin subunit